MPGRKLLVLAASVGSVVVGSSLVAIGTVIRSDRTVAAGKRRFHGHAFDRRWINDDEERDRHADVVAERLDLDTRQPGEVSLAEAADRLGVSIGTVRRRAKRGQLQAAYSNGRLMGVILEVE